MPQFYYVLASPEASVDVIAFGKQTVLLQKTISPLLGSLTKIESAQWNCNNRNLTEIRSTNYRDKLNIVLLKDVYILKLKVN